MLHTRIRELRRHAGMTQSELAAALGYRGKQVISGWESGRSSPPSTKLPELAAALRCKVDDLFAEAAGEAA